MEKYKGIRKFIKDMVEEEVTDNLNKAKEMYKFCTDLMAEGKLHLPEDNNNIKTHTVPESPKP